MHTGAWWAELKAPTSTSPTALIRDFYYAEPTNKAQLLKGDFACANFDEHVRCHHVTPTFRRDFYIDPTTLSPVDDAFVIFYWYAPQYARITVLCGIPHEILVNKYKGHVNESMWAAHQTRAFLPRLTHESMGTITDEVKPVEMPFYWPTKMGTILEYASQLHVECDGDQSLGDKVNWYFGGEKQLHHHLSNIQDWATTRVCVVAVCGDLYKCLPEHRWVHQRFFSIIMEAERGLLMKRLAEFDTEASLFRLFNYNHCAELLTEDTWMVDGTPLDQQCFIKMYPNATYIPICYLKVPLIEIPNIINMPKYNGGFVHLPMYWEAVGAWLFHRFLAQAQRRELKAPKVKCLDEVYSGVEYEVGFVRHHIVTTQVEKVCGSSSRRGGAAPTAAPTPRPRQEIPEMPDIEDLWRDDGASSAIIPPCIAQIRHSAERFPFQTERLAIVAILWRAGFNEDMITRIFFEWNERLPKKPYEELDKRFQFKDYLARGDEMGNFWCANAVDNARKKKTDYISCPFVQQLPVVQGTNTEVGLQCQRLCMPEAKWPFGGPHNFIKNRLRSRGGCAAPTPQQQK